MKVVRWLTTASMILSAGFGAYRVYKNWQLTRESNA